MICPCIVHFKHLLYSPHPPIILSNTLVHNNRLNPEIVTSLGYTNIVVSQTEKFKLTLYKFPKNISSEEFRKHFPREYRIETSFESFPNEIPKNFDYWAQEIRDKIIKKIAPDLEYKLSIPLWNFKQKEFPTETKKDRFTNTNFRNNRREVKLICLNDEISDKMISSFYGKQILGETNLYIEKVAEKSFPINKSVFLKIYPLIENLKLNNLGNFSGQIIQEAKKKLPKIESIPGPNNEISDLIPSFITDKMFSVDDSHFQNKKHEYSSLNLGNDEHIKSFQYFNNPVQINDRKCRYVPGNEFNLRFPSEHEAVNLTSTK